MNIVNIREPISTSDHCVIDFSMYIDNEEHPVDASITLPVYNWSAANYDAMNDFLLSFDWNIIFGFYFDADSIWSEFKKVLWHVITLHVPKKLVSHKLKYRPRHYSRNIRTLLSRKAAIRNVSFVLIIRLISKSHTLTLRINVKWKF